MQSQAGTLLTFRHPHSGLGRVAARLLQCYHAGHALCDHKLAHCSPSATHTVGFAGSQPASFSASTQEASLRSQGTAAQEPQRSGNCVLSMLLQEGRGDAVISAQREPPFVDAAAGRQRACCVFSASGIAPCLWQWHGREPSAELLCAVGRARGSGHMASARSTRPTHLRAGRHPSPEVAAQPALHRRPRHSGQIVQIAGAALAVGAWHQRHLGQQLAQQLLLGGCHIGLIQLEPAQVCNAVGSAQVTAHGDLLQAAVATRFSWDQSRCAADWPPSAEPAVSGLSAVTSPQPQLQAIPTRRQLHAPGPAVHASAQHD